MALTVPWTFSQHVFPTFGVFSLVLSFGGQFQRHEYLVFEIGGTSGPCVVRTDVSYKIDHFFSLVTMTF